MKRLVKDTSSSDSDAEIDISEIKNRYKPERKKSKFEANVSSKSTKTKKSDEKIKGQKTIESSFSNIKTSKRKAESSIESYFKKSDKSESLPKQTKMTAEAFFSATKIINKETAIIRDEINETVPSDDSKFFEDFVIEESCEEKQTESKPVKTITPISSPSKLAKEVDKSISTPKSNKGNYHAYLNRSKPEALGSKELPEGDPNCLIGMTFVVTGVLDSIERDDAESLIQRNGGKVTKAVSGKTSYLVIGREPGEGKIKKAVQFKTKQISEDELFDLIRSQSEKMKKGDASCTIDAVKQQKKQKQQTPKGNSKVVKDKAKDIIEPKDLPMLAVESKNKTKISPAKHLTDTLTASSTNSCKVPTECTDLSAKPLIIIPKTTELFVDKYRPKEMKKIVGQFGERSAANKLLAWLKNWDRALKANFQLSGEGEKYRSALLSGSPGIGKTTTAQIVAKECGYRTMEFNASMTRSKTSLREEVATIIHNNSVWKEEKNLCIVMDEVDGMAGNEDRGGISELIQFIKTTRHPIICICNDKSSTKMRSLVNHVYDVPFRKPSKDQCKALIKFIASREKFSIPDDVMDDIVNSSNSDLRQIINNLQMWSAGRMDSNTLRLDALNSQKEMKIGSFDVVRKVFSHESVKTFTEKSDLFFNDYQLNGLFVQECYLDVRPYKANRNDCRLMKLISLAADSISYSDVVSNKLRKTNEWSLLPTQAMFASVIPGEYMHGHLTVQARFPSWLGKFSKTNKNYRILNGLSTHLTLSTSGSISNPAILSMDYSNLLKQHILTPLQQGDIETTVKTLQSFNLLREDIDLLVETTTWPNGMDRYSAINAKIKAALTKECKKNVFKTPYADIDFKRSNKKAAVDVQDFEGTEEQNDEGNNSDNNGDDDDDLMKDKMIKAVKKAKPSKTETKTTKAKSSGKGKKAASTEATEIDKPKVEKKRKPTTSRKRKED